jgi:VanZ family protein
MIRWLLVGLWYAAIVFTSSLTSTPESGQPWRDFLIAKAGHIFVYSILGGLLASALSAPAAGLALGPRLALLASIVTGALLASLDETRQTFVVGRYGQAGDVLLDTLSLSGGALLQQWLAGRLGPSAQQQPADDHHEQQPVKDQHQLLHRQDLPVAVDVRQERDHDAKVQHDKDVERPGAEGSRGR